MNMNPMREGLFVAAHSTFDPRFYFVYSNLLNNLNKDYAYLENQQDELLRKMICYSVDQVPYYTELFKKLKLKPSDIKTKKDLKKIPILKKETIKRNWEKFKPLGLQKIKYFNNATGGSTGTPFKYRYTKYERLISGCLTYRGWSYGGYDLAEKMVFLAGSSLGMNYKSKLITKVHEVTRNVKKLSAFDMGDTEMSNYLTIINNYKPEFIRGYASSIYFFAKWLKENNFSVYSPQSIFTTAEKLLPNMRTLISEVFTCNVYDGYGLNDGGLSAFETKNHEGLRIDTERSILEIENEKIIATSLLNYSLPFIRYNTGDRGTEKRLKDGTRVLTEIKGRQQEMLKTPEGKNIHGEFFTHIFWEIPYVKKFQVVQNSLDKIIIKIIPEKGFSDVQKDKIRDIIKKRSPKWEIDFQIIESIKTTKAGKYRFIINNLPK